MFYQPTFLKDNLLPSFEQAKQAEKKAENPDIKVRDTRELMAILMRIVDANPRLRGHILTRRTALSSFSWDILPYDDAEAVRAEEAKTRLRKVIRRVIQHHTDAPLFGAGVIELQWSEENGANGKLINNVRRLLPIEVMQPFSDMPLMQVSLDEKATKTPLDTPMRYLVDVYSDGAQGGTLRTILRQQILLDMQYRGFAEFNRRLKGVLLGKWKEGTEDTDKQITIDAIKNVGANDYAATADTITIDLVEAVSKGGHLAYTELIDRINANTAIAVLGQANTSELSGTGSRAALQVLKMISADIMFEDMLRVEAIINEQLLTYDFQMNYAIDAIEAPYKFAFNWHEENNSLTEAQVIREALAAGVPLPKSEVYQRIGYTMPAPETEVIAPTVPSIVI